MVGRASEKGFTFVEVIVAVMVLAIATSVLIGLEATAIQRAIRDRNTQQAMLVARRILAMVENSEQSMTMTSQSDVPVAALLAQLGAPATSDDGERQALDRLRATVLVEDWTPPEKNISEPAMKRVTLSIAWGPDQFERFTLLYFIPYPEAV
jgi:prepilin-type N-terminal cleavage/methylation domain-containing protein